MNELILHTGTTKTGTTSLQGFFSANREKLAEQGVAYPSFTEQPWPDLLRNGTFLNRYHLALARGEGPYLILNDTEENLQTLATSLPSHRHSLISSKNTSLASAWLTDTGHATERYWVSLAKTLTEAGMQKATIVVYLRRQDDWAASEWRQRVKGAHEDSSLEEFCAKPSIRLAMDYAGLLAELVRAFGDAAHVVVRRYDRDCFAGGDIHHNFCAAAGILWNDNYQIIQNESSSSLSFDVAEAVRSFAEVAPARTPLRTDILLPLAQNISRAHPDAPGTTPFDEETTLRLMKPYLEGNRLISERYLDGEPLFSEEYGGRPVWIPNEGRTIKYRAKFEKAVQRYQPPSGIESASSAFASKLPEGFKRPLRAVRKELLSR